MISKKNILNFETRRKIYEFVEENPGLHIEEISRRITIPRTTLLHHIRILEKQDLINEKKEGGYKRIYTQSQKSTFNKEILGLLRKKIPCRIMLQLFFQASCSQIELSQELNLHPTTISYHLKKMVKMGIIEEATAKNGFVYPFPNSNLKDIRVLDKTPKGREIFYCWKNIKISREIGRIMYAYKNSLADTRYIDEFFSYYIDIADIRIIENNFLKIAKKKVIEKDGKKVTHFIISNEKKFLDFFLEYFKPPFCS